jgi:hypothetical protein
VFNECHLSHLPQPSQRAIRNAVRRVEVAEAEGDVEAVVGSSKELVETVSKSVLGALGGVYGSDIQVEGYKNRISRVTWLNAGDPTSEP